MLKTQNFYQPGSNSQFHIVYVITVYCWSDIKYIKFYACTIDNFAALVVLFHVSEHVMRTASREKRKTCQVIFYPVFQNSTLQFFFQVNLVFFCYTPVKPK